MFRFLSATKTPLHLLSDLIGQGNKSLRPPPSSRFTACPCFEKTQRRSYFLFLFGLGWLRWRRKPMTRVKAMCVCAPTSFTHAMTFWFVLVLHVRVFM